MASESGGDHMRLVCPSCGAEYEVDDSVIPEAGRDVQCSNCGQAWFQASAAQQRAEEAAANVPEDSQDWTEDEGEADESEEVTPSADASDTAVPEQPDAAQEDTAPPADMDTAQEAQEPTPELPSFKRRTLDDAVLNVLREEAAREARARSTGGATLETQPDLGLSSAAAAAVIEAGNAQKDRVARTRGDGDGEEDDEDALVSKGSRRELLPDIEEINSTLRATSERGGDAASRDAPETLRRRRSGFRLGFSISVMSAAILLATYLLAPVIAAQVPTLEPVMVRYVKGIDKARLWVDGQMQSLTESMRKDDNGS